MGSRQGNNGGRSCLESVSEVSNARPQLDTWDCAGLLARVDSATAAVTGYGDEPARC
jgi:hypothetical protein